MNNTITEMASENGYEYSTIVLGVLLFTSEILPFLKAKDKHNGIFETLICILRGSSCLAEKIADTLETGSVQKEDIDKLEVIIK